MEELQSKTRKQILKDKKDTRICLRVNPYNQSSINTLNRFIREMNEELKRRRLEKRKKKRI